MRLQVRGPTRLLLLLAIPLALLSALDDYAGWRFLLLALGGATGLAWLWAVLLAQGLRLEREIRLGWAQVGDVLEERFSLYNDSPLPALWLAVEDQSDLPDYRPNLVMGLDSRSRAAWQTHIVCTRRGLFTLGPTRLHSADPLGLFSVTIYDERTRQVMVMPPVAALPQIEVAAGGKTGPGRPRPNSLERTINAAGVRPYLSGDSLRHMHWPSTARRGQPYVRTFDNTPSGDWWLALDACASVQAGRDPQSTLEHGIILAASLAERGLRLRRAVGLAAASAAPLLLPPRHSDAQRWLILRALAALEPGTHPLAALLARLQDSLSGQSSLVIITSDTRPEWLESLLPLMWKGIAPTILLLDPAAFATSEQAAALQAPPAARLTAELARRGIAHELITPALLAERLPSPAGPGAQWRVTPSGRAIPTQDLKWRRL